MKDLTHYFQFPAKEKRDKNREGNVGTKMLNGDSGTAEPKKVYETQSNPVHAIENNSSLSSSNLDIENSPSNLRSTSQRVGSEPKICFKVISDLDNTECIESNRHSTILHKEDISFSQRFCIETSGKTLYTETSTQQTASTEKEKVNNLKKLSLSSQKINSSDITNKSTSVQSMKTKILEEVFVEKSSKRKRHSLFQKNTKSSPMMEIKSMDCAEDKSSKSCKEGTLSKKKLSLSSQKCDKYVDRTKKDFKTDITNRTCIDKPSQKIFPTLNERTNAFHILMSSRVCQSPYDQSPDEAEDQNMYSSADMKETKTVLREAPEKTVEMRENRKKRKKKLENMAEKRRLKKAKLSGSSSEIEIQIGKSPRVSSKRIIIVSESDSDDDRNTTLVQDTDILKVKDDDKQVPKKSSKIIVEETDDESAEPCSEKELLKKKDNTVKYNSLSSNKQSTRTLPREMKKSGRKSVHKNSHKLMVEETDCSELEEDRTQLKELEKISPDQITRKSRNCSEDSDKKVHEGRWKLVVGDREQECNGTGTRKKREKKQGSASKDRMVKCKLSLCKSKEMSSKKLHKSTKETLLQYNKTPVKNSFKQGVKKSLNYQEGGKLSNMSKVMNDSMRRETWVVNEDENHKQAQFNEDGTNEATSENNEDSKCETLTKPKEALQSPDSSDETKKRNSLLSYFNKVCKDEVFKKSEKIQVKVQVHSPPASPSKKKRSTSVPKSRVDQRCYSLRSRMSDMEDQIVVLESHIVKPANNGNAVLVITTPRKCDEICDLKTPLSSNGWKMRVRLRESSAETVSDDNAGGNSSDDHIFTPKKKWLVNKTSVQQKAAREVLRKAKMRVKHMNAKQIRDQDSKPVATYRAEEEVEKVTICTSRDNKSNAAVKLAPLFIGSKGVPKPKVDPTVVEARRNFLKSGVPESVKKMVDMQRSMEERYNFMFPSVAHVQQRDDQLSIWNLPAVEVRLHSTQTESTTLSSKQIEKVKLGTFSDFHSTDTACAFTKPSTPTPITCFRKLLHILKLELPDLPVYRNFRRLRSKYSNIPDVEKSTETVSLDDIKQKRRGGGRKSRLTRSGARKEEQKKESFNLNSHVMWTEKYKPTTVDDIIGSGHSIEHLKKWLESWKRYSDEVKHRDKSGGHKRKDSSSGDEFMDSDSNDSSNGNLPNNTAILVGPHGCGKTSAVYAIANELGCKVLEINTSSKRNGKRILSELQEATQSHQVQAGAEHVSGGLGSFFKGESTKKTNTESKAHGNTSRPKQEGDDQNSSKMSLILVEGVDVVYEDQDEGFVSALSSLVASSKRPVILITNDPHCPHLARFMDLHLVLKFSAPSSRTMSMWLHLVCLLEGVRLRRAEIERLLNHNCGDVRQTLLQLQFWVLTGGNNWPHTTQICKNALSENIVAPQVSAVDVADEHSNLSFNSGDEADDTPVGVPEHSNCIEMFTEYREENFNSCQIPFPLDLGHVWWNLSSLLSIQDSLYWDKIGSWSCDDVTGKETSPEVGTDSCDVDSVVKIEDSEAKSRETDSIIVDEVCSKMSLEKADSEMTVCMTVSNKDKVVSVEEDIDKGDSEHSVLKRNIDESGGKLISELSVKQSAEKTSCSQVVTDCLSRLMETMSALDVMSSDGSGGNKEPCLRSWDKVPKDGTSLNEGTHCLWWENSVSRILCHYLLEGSVHKSRSSLQEVQGCQKVVNDTRVTFTKPTQQELRWRLVQHAAEDSILSAVPLWCRSDHNSVASDYIPMLRAVSRCEQGRLACNTKRRNRFFHYLKGLNIHVSDATLDTLCAVFASRHTT